MTDLAGAMVELYAYDAYGNAIGFDPAAALTEFLYSGEQFDSKIGQQYLRQRYYDPSTGRFNRLDPFFGNHSDPQSFHKYTYVHGDPINGIDPSGLFTVGSVMSSLGISGNMRASITSAATRYGWSFAKNLGSTMLKDAIIKGTVQYMFGNTISSIKKELTFLAIDLAPISPDLSNTIYKLYGYYEMIQSLLSISDYCTPTAKHLIKATIKTIPGRLGVLGETILTGMKFMSYAKYTGYAIVAGAAGIAAPLMIDFSGELLTKLGYPTNIDMTVKGALIADVQMLLGATPFYGHNDEISLTQNPLSLLGFQTGESPLIRDYGSLRTVELDKIIANMRLVVQVNNGGVQSDLNAAARSYANQLSRLFSPHINITTDF